MMTSNRMDEIEIGAIASGHVDAAVLVRNAYKSYTPTSKVLRGLNLTVPSGAIYGLLGPSGCGKTTLLNCVAGRMNLDSGTVQLKIKRRSELGYMPQDLSLHGGLSIMENFNFYGYLFGLEDNVIRSRADELIAFLDLPLGHRLLSELSGGQQRRISLAVTIFHDPKLMILDEPTVGLDPILSQSIWEYLLKMAANGKTIIITTHYIQEARQAHMIGLLRNGKLLAEEPPDKLMEKSNCDNLEEAFLKLSIIQEDVDDKQVTPEPKKNLAPKTLQFEEDHRLFSRKKFGGVMYKNWTLLKREYTILILILMLPFLQTYFFCMTTGRTPKHLKLAVINDEASLAECAYKSNHSTGCFLDDTENVPLSCLYLDFLTSRTYELVEYDNETAAVNDVYSTKVWGLIHFPRNYTKSFAQRVIDGQSVDPVFVDGSFTDIWIDLSNRIIGTLLKQDIARAMQAFLYKAMVNCGLNPKVISFPLSLETPIFGSFTEEFISYSSNPLICLLCFFLPSISAALRLYVEKSEGILERMIINGVTIKEMLISIGIIQIVIHCVQYAIIMLIVKTTTDVVFRGSFLTLSILMLLVGLVGMLYGFFVALAGSDLMLIAYSGMGSTFTLSFLSGLLSSTETAHVIIRVVRLFMPLCREIDAARGISIKGFPFSHPQVYQGFIAAGVWMLIFTLLLYLTAGRKKSSYAPQK